MAFAGVPNAKDRGDLIAYLKEAKWAPYELCLDIVRQPHFCVHEALASPLESFNGLICMLRFSWMMPWTEAMAKWILMNLIKTNYKTKFDI